MVKVEEKKPRQSNGTELWKTAALVLAGMLVTGATSWITFGSRYLSKDEIMNIIQTQTPYAMERTYIRDRLKTIERISASLDLVKADVVKLNVKMDMLIQHAGLKIPTSK